MAVTHSQPTTRTVRRVASFTGNGTWTVPAGTRYAVAHVMGGGGSTGVGTSGSYGSQSSVALPAGTVIGRGGTRSIQTTQTGGSPTGRNALANTGAGAAYAQVAASRVTKNQGNGGNAQYNVGGSEVTPGASISVVVGSGGAAGTSGGAGGSGYVWIEFWVAEQAEPEPVLQTQPEKATVLRAVGFTGNGTWNVPEGVTYAVARMIGGGAGVGTSSGGGNGAASSVAFPTGTVTANGGNRVISSADTFTYGGRAGIVNTGGGAAFGYTSDNMNTENNRAGDSQYTVAGSTVTPGQNVSVVVGAGGAAGANGAAGGSGYVSIEFEQEVLV